jgi:Uma2 family endonuclease
MISVTRVQMTAEEYRKLPESDEQLQLIAGELIVAVSPVDMHQLVGGNTYGYLFVRLGARRLRYEADLYLGVGDVPRPDIFWVHLENQGCKVIDGYWHGTPDLIVEILSPSTAKLDRGKKYQLYERYGVREYWIIDPADRALEVYHLKDGQYVRLGFFEPGMQFGSLAAGIEIEVTALFDGVDEEQAHD